MYKMMFFDLDGTLLNDNKEILMENIEAIKKAKENGIEIAICSGRQKNFVERCRKMAGTGKFIIACNGSAIYDVEENEEIFSCSVDKNLVYNLYQLSQKNNFYIRIDTRYARYLNDMKYFFVDEIPLEEEIEKFLAENNVLQVTFGTKTEEEIDNIINELKDNPYVKIENKYQIDNNYNKLWVINIINTSASKGNAISGLCKYLKIDLKDVIAFGDDLNDLSMMKTVGLGVAMENALPDVKQFAKEVIGNNNKPSIAEFIYKIIEENKNA